MRIRIHKVLAGIAFLLVLFPVSAPAQQIALDVQVKALELALRGLWSAEIGNTRIKLRIEESGEYEMDGMRGTYTVRGTSLVLSRGTDSEISYAVAFTGRDQLTLSGGDLSQPMKFVRLQETTGVLLSYFRISPTKLRDKAVSIGIILAIAILSRLFLGLLKFLSGVLIFSQRGFFKRLYTENKNRRRTIHSLTLDVMKYVVYFTAFGFVLSEIGVNYTAYLASLSVIGLAVGFGSQGLVQDIVTGFFIVFEGQFDVGDMVEVSGQIGLVRSVGLRMTKIQNYQGQLFYIPNRNIAVVGKYQKGALEGFVDVALESKESFTLARSCAKKLAGELSRQFEEVFLCAPHAEPMLKLKTEEMFLRIHVSVWPGQQWVIDQQFIPRLREAFAKAAITIHGDRIVAFYHLRDTQEVPSLKDRLRFLKSAKRK